jgi:hypothetical protein
MGIYHMVRRNRKHHQHFSHACGDMPNAGEDWEVNHLFFPHAWGFTCETQSSIKREFVLPTHVGINRL